MWEPKDVIVAILATSVAILVVAVPIIRIITGEAMNPEAAKITGAVVAAVITLIGVHIGMKK